MTASAQTVEPVAEDPEISQMKREVEKMKSMVSLQKQISELRAMQSGIAQSPQKQANWMNYAMPAGFVLAGLGVVLGMFLGQMVLGLLLCGIGAVPIGLKLAGDPTFRLPQNLNPKSSESEAAANLPQKS